MKRDYTIIEKMNRTNWKERGLSILISLSFHVVVIFFLIKLVPPVRVHLYRQVADVRIVEPSAMYLPRIAGLSEAQTPGGTASQPSPVEGLPVQDAEDAPIVEPDPGVVYLKNLAIVRDVEQTAQSFDLVPSPKTKGSFSLGISRKKPEKEKREEVNTRQDLDFSRYSPSALSSLQFNRLITKKGGGVRDTAVSDRLEGYDIAPWVKQVVDKIRNKWTLPPIDASIAIGEVKILIIVGKTGNLISMEIVKASDFPVFDQTTTAAIRSSAPFPPLPEDFPLERLEAFLVFEFHE